MRTIVFIFASLIQPLAHADVTAHGPGGFVSQWSFTIAAPRERVFRALTEEVGRWWDPAHSYSRDAANFSIDARPGGCFCERLGERLADGGVQHMTVVFVKRNAMLRMLGGLGPLQGMAVSGSMTLTVSDAGTGTLLKYEYAVGGYAPDGLDQLAEPVDRVQQGQLLRLQRYIETGSPAAAAPAAP
jgi:uncharacterized protein YndB with AHSA1/START domain